MNRFYRRRLSLLSMILAASSFMLSGLICTGTSLAQESDAPTSSRQLLRSYRSIYQEFVDEFRAADGESRRIELLETATTEIHQLLEPHQRGELIEGVLPELAGTRIIDMKPVFLDVIQNHPELPAKALALYSLARYFGTNGQDELCMMSLQQLDRSFGDLEYDGRTYSEHVAELTYFFENLAVGRQAPAISGEDVDGALFQLSDYRGKVVMLRFWGHWCPACRAMYPYEREVVERYSNAPFALIGVNSDQRETTRRAQQSDALTWRSFWDGGDTMGPIAKTFAVSHWPTIIVVDADGVIQYRSQGLAEDQLNEVLDRLVLEAGQKRGS
ncbi:MAG: TlpA disulfide reductase family protein [Planctomycetota bacterium]